LVYDSCERIWLSIDDSDRLDGLVSDRLQVDVREAVIVTMEMIVIVTAVEFVTIGIHLYFRVEVRGKERGL
jgi:hypothetical protein